MANSMQWHTISVDSYLTSSPHINFNNNNDFLYNDQLTYGANHQLKSIHSSNVESANSTCFPTLSHIKNIPDKDDYPLTNNTLENDAFHRSCNRTLLRRAALVAPITRQSNSRLQLNLSKLLAINPDQPQSNPNDSLVLPNSLLTYPEPAGSSNSICSSESDSFDDEPTVVTPPPLLHISRWTKEKNE
jgi:hypothetical protein